MPASGRGFSRRILALIRDGKMLAIRAGADHRFIHIWAVVLEDRVFVRSWSLKPRSWYRTFLEEPRGAIQVGSREIPVRAIRTRRERLQNAVSRAYLANYDPRGPITSPPPPPPPKSSATP